LTTLGLVAADKVLEDRDWGRVENAYFETDPYNYTVIDNFLTPQSCAAVREAIVQNKGWSFMNWQAEELFIRNFNLPIVKVIAKEISECLPRILGDLSLVQHIAFMHKRNKGLCSHSDTGMVTVDLWLTPDEYNLEPEFGGLLLYDVKRQPGQSIHEFNARPWCTEYCEKNTKGGYAQVPYKYNRAVIFDARTFHASDRINFVADGAHTFRINYALLFDHADDFRDRYDRYR
jgi:hypothetical protein